MSRLFFLFLIFIFHDYFIYAHKGRDPLLYYDFQKKFFKNKKLESQRGINLPLMNPKFQEIDGYQFLLNHTNEISYIDKEGKELLKEKMLPESQFTVEVCFSLDFYHKEDSMTGSILGTFKKNKDFSNQRSGWLLGYVNRYVTFILHTSSSNTESKAEKIFLQSKTPIQQNRFYHVIAINDEKQALLYINGKLLAVVKKKNDKIIYPKDFNLAFFGYQQSGKLYFHKGLIRSIRLWDGVLTTKGVNHYFTHFSEIIKENL